MRTPRRTWTAMTALGALAMTWSGGFTPLAAQGQGAQGPPPARSMVQTVQVKPDMATAWLALQRDEVVPTLKKAGMPWRWVYSTGTPIGSGFTFTIAQPLQNYAQIDEGPAMQKVLGPEGVARYNAKVRPMIVSTHTRVQTLVANASLVSFLNSPPSLLVVTTLLVQPGKGAEFASITATDFVPAMKKSGVVDYWVFATNFGGSPGQRTIVTPLPNFAALDSPNPLARALGADGAQKANAKRQAVIASADTADTSVMRLVPDLSFGAPAPPKR